MQYFIGKTLKGSLIYGLDEGIPLGMVVDADLMSRIDVGVTHAK
jgi:hypothetical protein